MMESVRTKTEGGSAKPVVAAVAAKAPAAASSERFPGLDKDLMERADRVAEEMRAMDEPKAPEAAAKKAALASESQESRRDRAARFFATHGMKGVGSMLGDTISANAEAAAIREQESNRRLVQKAMSETGVTIPKMSSSASSAPSSAGWDAIDDMQDEEDAAAQARWKAVDALRRKRPHLD